MACLPTDRNANVCPLCKEKKKISFFLVSGIPISDTIFMLMILEPLLLYY